VANRLVSENKRSESLAGSRFLPERHELSGIIGCPSVLVQRQLVVEMLSFGNFEAVILLHRVGGSFRKVRAVLRPELRSHVALRSYFDSWSSTRVISCPITVPMPPIAGSSLQIFHHKRLARQIPADTSNKLTRDFEIIAVLGNISEILLAEKTSIREKHKKRIWARPKSAFHVFHGISS
jgi:hypothetical protein